MNCLTEAIIDFKAEIKEDLPFFGICGFTIGVMAICNFDITWIKWIEVENLQKLALKIFEDFLSPHAFGFIYFIYVVFGSAINAASKILNRNFQILKNAVNHTGRRLNQIGSSIISFILGFSIFALIISCQSQEYLRLFSISLLFAIFIAMNIVMAKILQREQPFDLSFIVLLAAGSFVYLLIQQVGHS